MESRSEWATWRILGLSLVESAWPPFCLAVILVNMEDQLARLLNSKASDREKFASLFSEYLDGNDDDMENDSTDYDSANSDSDDEENGSDCVNSQLTRAEIADRMNAVDVDVVEEVDQRAEIEKENVGKFRYVFSMNIQWYHCWTTCL